MTLIKGTYRILNTAPDGDSIRFYANQPEAWTLVERRVRTHGGGSVQLRLEGIDTLETHYSPPYGNGDPVHQPIALGHAAAAELLEFLGFKRVTRQQDEQVTTSIPEEVPGYILSRYSDRHGRVVAFVFAGDTPQPDGQKVRVSPDWIQTSANLHLLRAGLAYPGFYTKLYPDLRQSMAIVTQSARAEEIGIWEKDQTNTGFELKTLQTLTRDVVILPKLFRRLVSYITDNEGEVDLLQFSQYLDESGDRVLFTTNDHTATLSSIIVINHQTLKLTVPPESLLFAER
jgi:endonuclease YncB( thermonuclease family)